LIEVFATIARPECVQSKTTAIDAEALVSPSPAGHVRRFSYAQFGLALICGGLRNRGKKGLHKLAHRPIEAKGHRAVLPFALPLSFTSEQKFQRNLNNSRPHVLLNLPEVRRADVADRQPEIRMIEKIKQLSPELKFLGLGDVNILER
jgi:hypothetical protein